MKVFLGVGGAIVAVLVLSLVLRRVRTMRERKRWADSIGKVVISYSEHLDEWYGGVSGEADERALQQATTDHGPGVAVVLLDTEVSHHLHFGGTYTYTYKVVRA